MYFPSVSMLSLLILTVAQWAYPQSQNEFHLSCDIHHVIKPLSISYEVAQSANQIKDIYPHFKPEWVKAYNKVTLSGQVNGKEISASGENQILTEQQQNIISNIDEGHPITLNISYYPRNTLPFDELKNLKVTFEVRPLKNASFPIGAMSMNEFIENNILSKVSKTDFRAHHLTAVQFTIDQSGNLLNPYIKESSGNKKVDDLLMESLCNMPIWSPAIYKSGQTVNQDFVLVIGDMKSCVLNLLNIEQKWLDN